jgi:hypothetical protein
MAASVALRMYDCACSCQFADECPAARDATTSNPSPIRKNISTLE